MKIDTMRALTIRVDALTRLYQDIAILRMKDMPIVNATLHVQAIGFEAWKPSPDSKSDAPAEEAAYGILITPWFMNIIWMPLKARASRLRVGGKCQRHVGNTKFEFISTYEVGFGAYEACSLFSPMFEFADQATAIATAQSVLQCLRIGESVAANSTALANSTAALDNTPSRTMPRNEDAIVAQRRAFLLGQRAVGAPRG